mmetsp:Transcript_13650/g.29668  ORF Transcript_13650/g.29668 Transcript_13650/m.29668 type:complete len:247 (+) Transcript_13650:214-954(+)
MPCPSDCYKVEVSFVSSNKSTHSTAGIESPWPPLFSFIQTDVHCPILSLETIKSGVSISIIHKHPNAFICVFSFANLIVERQEIGFGRSVVKTNAIITVKEFTCGWNMKRFLHEGMADVFFQHLTTSTYIIVEGTFCINTNAPPRFGYVRFLAAKEAVVVCAVIIERVLVEASRRSLSLFQCSGALGAKFFPRRMQLFSSALSMDSMHKFERYLTMSSEEHKMEYRSIDSTIDMLSGTSIPHCKSL